MSLITKSFSILSRFVKAGSTRDQRLIARWVAPTMKILKHRRERIGPEPEESRSKYLEWNYEAELFAFGNRLGEKFDRNILKKALIQREYANLKEFENKDAGTSLSVENNHALIEEGNILISSYIKQYYNKAYPEVIVDAVHNYLTSETMLAHIGKHIGLTDIILTNEYPVVEKTLSDTFKAIVSALRHSQDQKKAEQFVNDFLLAQMNGKDISDIWEPKDPYEYLTKLLSKKGIKDIEPRLCNESATNTVLACFQVGIYNNKKLLGIGWGESVHIAKDSAALDAIYKIYNTHVEKL